MSMTKELIQDWRKKLLKNADHFFILDANNQVSKLDLDDLTDKTPDEQIVNIVRDLAKRQAEGAHLMLSSNVNMDLAKFYRVNTDTKKMEQMEKPSMPVKPALFPPMEVEKPALYKRMFKFLNSDWKAEVKAYHRYKEKRDIYNSKVSDMSQKERDAYIAALGKYRFDMKMWEKNPDRKFYDNLDIHAETILKNYRAALKDAGRQKVEKQEAEKLRTQMHKEIKTIEAALDESEKKFNEAQLMLQPDPKDNWEKTASAAAKLNQEFTSIAFSRQTGRNICAGILLCHGHSVEDVLDPTKLTEEKKKVVNEVKEKVENGDFRWVALRIYESMNKASELLEKRFCKLQNKVPSYTRQDLLHEMPVLSELGNIAHDLNQEVNQPILKEARGKMLINVDVEADTHRACMLAGMVLGLQKGFRAEATCYCNALGCLSKEKVKQGIQFVASDLMVMEYIQNAMMKKVAEEANVHGRVSKNFADTNYAQMMTLRGSIVMNGGVEQYTRATLDNSGDPRMFRAGYLPLAYAIASGNGPKVTRIETDEPGRNRVDLEGIERIHDQTIISMRKMNEVIKKEKMAVQDAMLQDEAVAVPWTLM